MLRIEAGVYEYRGHTILRLSAPPAEARRATRYPKHYPREWSIRPTPAAAEDVYPTLSDAAYGLDQVLDGECRRHHSKLPNIRTKKGNP
jgi:hypothetical protein